MLKRRTFKRFFSVCVSVIVLTCMLIYIYIQNQNYKSQKKLLNLADNIINENIVNFNSKEISPKEECEENETEEGKENKDIVIINKIDENKNILGKIKISKIGVEAPILDGTTKDILKISVGHFLNSSYWNGNVALASHNRGTYAHYFENINKLNIGDEITYQTKFGTRIYTIDEIEKISEEDLSILEYTKINTMTLITCIKNSPNLRLCIKATEKNYV